MACREFDGHTALTGVRSHRGADPSPESDGDGVETMKPESPASIRETDNPEGRGESGASNPPKPDRIPRRPLRLFHLMALVAAVALTLIIPPALMTVITQPLSGWGWREQLTYQASFARDPLDAVPGANRDVRRTIPSSTRQCLIRDWSGLRGDGGTIPAPCPRFDPRVYLVSPRLSRLPVRKLLLPDGERIRGHAPGAASAIIAAWLILALTGAGRRPSDWFDRFCFVFGQVWILWCLGSDFMWLIRLP